MMHQVKARVAELERYFGALWSQVTGECIGGNDAGVSGEARGKIREQGSCDARGSAAAGGDARYL